MSKRNGIYRICKCGKIFYVQGFRLSDPKRGKFCSPECYRKSEKGIRKSVNTEFRKGQFVNENHPNWKGDEVGYGALHIWILRHWGKAKKCINGHIEKVYQWANITGIYNRDKVNWAEMCLSCHRKEDAINPKRPKI